MTQNEPRKHTPGPWKWKWEYKDLGWFNPGNTPTLRGPDEKAIIEGYSPYEEGGIRSGYDEETATANAHIIAAAPELYEALIALRREPWVLPKPLVDKINAAIAKAEGAA